MPDEIVHTTETVVTETTTLPPAPKVSEHWDASQDAAQIEAAVAPLREELAKLRHDVEDDAEVLDALCHNQRLEVMMTTTPAPSPPPPPASPLSPTAAVSVPATPPAAPPASTPGPVAAATPPVTPVAAEPKPVEPVAAPAPGKKAPRGLLATLFFGRTRE